MHNIIKNGGHNLFLPSLKARGLTEPLIAACKAANREYLENNPPGRPAAAITGSFIYAHPPNYSGINTLHYTSKDWLCLLDRIRQLGMDTVIFQAAVWNELGECYYPSKHFSGYKIWNVIEPMLEAARELGLSVFLGGYGSVTGWEEKLDASVMAEEKLNQSACYRELLDYRELFDGFYFAPETAYRGKRDVEREQFLNRLYREFFLEIKERTPDMKILMSPATKHFPGKMTEMEDSWRSLLDGVPLDIMAPQDSIGSCGIRLAFQDEAYRVWSSICRDLGIVFWSNIELFERRDRLEGDSYNYAGAPERIAAQINHAAPYAEKLICWEAPFYLNPDFGNRNKLLRDYLNRARTGKRVSG